MWGIVDFVRVSTAGNAAFFCTDETSLLWVSAGAQNGEFLRHG